MKVVQDVEVLGETAFKGGGTNEPGRVMGGTSLGKSKRLAGQPFDMDMGPPLDLTDEGSELWYFIRNCCLDLDIIDELNRQALDVMVISYDRLIKAYKEAEDQEDMVLPVSLIKSAFTLFESFGLTPLSRSRVDKLVRSIEK